MHHRLEISLFRGRNLARNLVTGVPSTERSGGHERSDEHKGPFSFKDRDFLIGSLAAFIGYKFYDFKKRLALAQQHVQGNVANARPDLPYYTLEEVSKHTNEAGRIWVTYKGGVYDITKFVLEHPGGDQILLAAGSSVEPFWVLYAVHNNPHVLTILETLRIGNLALEDQVVDDMTDPYSADPKRHSILKPASAKPFNAEAPPFLLVEQFITPNELFYVRNHLPVPQIDPEGYELEVEIAGGGSLLLSLEDIKKLPKTTITATVMCAGNRRSDMTKIRPVKGLNWGPAAVGNARWTGVLLRDVLLNAGLNPDDCDTKFKHVQFEGIDLDATGTSYGASIPVWRAIDKRSDVLLAYEMNGEDIPRDHGYPIRVIVPGVVGARNVKWLGKIVVSDKESDSHWQQNDYKGFSPSTDAASADFTKSPAIQELPVISAICRPSDDEQVLVEDGHIVVKGYAWSGGGQRIVRVDVTADEGKTWHVAELQQDKAEPPRHWSWTLWSIKIPIDPERPKVEICCKAVDSSYNTQPERFENIWNFRGVLSNAYHRITVHLRRHN